MSETAPLLEAEDLKCHFDVSPPLLNRLIGQQPRQVVRAVDGVSFRIDKGTTFGLVGESGCGKSTLARLIVGLYQPNAGAIRFEGVDLAARAARTGAASPQARMQMIFQNPYASLNPRWRVAEIIAEPLRFRDLARGPAAISARVAELLRQVGLSPGDAQRYPHEFSGGQRQRISIARALAGEPDFLVCDEPTSALDVSVQAQILNLMKDLQRRLGLTYLFISHNLAVVYHVSDKVGVMYLGRVVEWADTESLFRRPQHPYTRMLLDAIPDLAMTGRPRTPVAGEVPSPLNPPSGCAFHPRCPFANARCRSDVPEDTKVAGGAVACHAVAEGRLPPWKAAG
ncbi:MAG TPA: oligopeptide/dipeptide ABC transporter ATP-binding protein [Alphaproteobacteria bacterium]|nr:oligopeptide/dipeptide ABC transporter ATP-binding protein [Alphaproteobacteria bacterium]